MSGLPTPVVPPGQMSFLAFDFGAKRTGDLIPLCHPIALTRVTVEFELLEAEPESAEEGADS